MLSCCSSKVMLTYYALEEQDSKTVKLVFFGSFLLHYWEQGEEVVASVELGQGAEGLVGDGAFSQSVEADPCTRFDSNTTT